MSFHSGDAGAGAPVFDEFGGLVGIAGAATEPVVIRRTYRAGDMMTEASQVLVLPIDLVHADGNVVTPLSELKARGLFMMPITLPGQVLSGGFATGILRAGPRTQPVDERDHFSKQEKHVSTFVTWDAKRTIKGLVVLRVYDIDNRLLGETKPMKVTLRPGDLSLSSWEFDVPSVTGTYRVDLLVGTDIVWRGFFDVTD